MFTQRHYIAFAHFIKHLDLGPRTKKKLIKELCGFFASDNYKFKEGLFTKACNNE